MRKIIAVLTVALAVAVFFFVRNREVAARVNRMPIFAHDLDEAIAEYNNSIGKGIERMEQVLLAPPSSSVYDRAVISAEQKAEFLKNEMINRALLYQEGLNRRLDKSKNIKKRLAGKKRWEKQMIIAKELAEKETANIEVSDKEIADYYNVYSEQLREPEERLVRKMVLSSEQLAQEVYIELLKGNDFKNLADKYAQSRYYTDRIMSVRRGQLSETEESVIFSPALKPGDLSQIFKVEGGFAIIKLETIKGGIAIPLADIKTKIASGLLFLKKGQAVQGLISGLSREAKIEIYRENIK